jgi:hypothetical protein
VRLRVPKLRWQTFETAIIERYRRRESSIEEALIEMYLAEVSVRRVEDITEEALWGTRVSDLNKKIYGKIEAWRNRPIEGAQYVYLDSIVLKRSWAGEVRNVSPLVAIGVNERGYREILGICEGAKEDKTGCQGRAMPGPQRRRRHPIRLGLMLARQPIKHASIPIVRLWRRGADRLGGIQRCPCGGLRPLISRRVSCSYLRTGEADSSVAIRASLKN